MKYEYEVVSIENKQLVTLRIPASMKRCIEDYAASNNMRKTDAYVHFLDKGLKSENTTDENDLETLSKKIDLILERLDVS